MKYRHLKGYKYELMSPVIFDVQLPNIPGNDYIRIKDGKMLTRKHYCWDGPSGPTIDTKTFMRGSLAHDALYQLMREGQLRPENYRDYADRMLRRICIEDGMSRFRAWYVYKAVRVFGKYTCVKRKNPRGGIVQICLAIMATLLMSGCTLAWTDKVFLVDFMRDRNIDSISLISEPNYIEIVAEKYKSETDNVKAGAVVGGVPVTMGTD